MTWRYTIYYEAYDLTVLASHDCTVIRVPGAIEDEEAYIPHKNLPRLIRALQKIRQKYEASK